VNYQGVTNGDSRDVVRLTLLGYDQGESSLGQSESSYDQGPEEEETGYPEE
jgi:hypothetical protein